MANNRKPRGRWKPGESGNPKGRPPKNYSIANALSLAAEQPQSVDDEGSPLTNAQLAADWIWRVVREGRDRRLSEDGDPEYRVVATKDRLQALQSILSRIEPDVKVNLSDLDDDQLERSAEQILAEVRRNAGRAETASGG